MINLIPEASKHDKLIFPHPSLPCEPSSRSINQLGITIQDSGMLRIPFPSYHILPHQQG
eukprot:c34876_g1_i1 orf=64-240(-)